MLGLSVPCEHKEIWQRTRRICWENSPKSLGNCFYNMLWNFRENSSNCCAQTLLYWKCAVLLPVSQQSGIVQKSAELSTMNASPPSHISKYTTTSTTVSAFMCSTSECQASSDVRLLTTGLGIVVLKTSLISFSMSGPNSSSEWSIEGRRLVPLMPRLVPQTAFTVTANAVASATANQNASLLLPAETGNKEGGSAFFVFV